MEFILLITPSLRGKIVIRKKNKMKMHPRYRSRSKQYIITEINGVQEVVFKVTYKVFPGAPVVKNASFHCKGQGFDGWSRN